MASERGSGFTARFGPGQALARQANFVKQHMMTMAFTSARVEKASSAAQGYGLRPL